MKYKIFEKLLNEVVGATDSNLIGEIEANSFEEAHKIARKCFPNKSTLKISGGSKSIDFDPPKN